MTEATGLGGARTAPSSSAPEGQLTLGERSLSLVLAGRQRHFHYVWLRDNSWAESDRVFQSSERKLFTPAIPATVAPAEAAFDPQEGLEVRWNDGQRSRYSPGWLRKYDYSEAPRSGRRHGVTLWGEEGIDVPRFSHADVVNTAEGELAYLDAVAEYGAAVVTGVPSVEHEVERFAETVGHVREVAFERVHNVRHDPAGYNVAHTPGELKPHTDLPSYNWPPSIQLLHFLTNQTTGGESTLVDGWAALAELRAQAPAHFATLCRVPVPYQLFSQDEDTWAENPMIQLDTDGNVKVFRFSNQLAQPLSIPFDEVEAFYDAYRQLGGIIDSGRHRATFKSADGDLVTVHSHRVLHGRLPYDPASGARHLQDVYMEFDDLLARRRVLRGEHKPLAAQPAGETREGR
ncbi:gamma-butyrobetaine dioxygenase [Tamaricihabitans halophyticus]|uniref:Gamma-butyrobetaine dioxygenase n=1 Tax=Tamaricihabitans halophyticus TaxID=1262583 RepID=A0A4R2QJR2_9PSEU|nr:TauD/TfdA family dioxygenase [Tamaricihabitans halophyticus]TCP47271.1 gamma-butyrobetaine dioxygenase [Tamaricihabitans halophyticus]